MRTKSSIRCSTFMYSFRLIGRYVCSACENELDVISLRRYQADQLLDEGRLFAGRVGEDYRGTPAFLSLERPSSDRRCEGLPKGQVGGLARKWICLDVSYLVWGEEFAASEFIQD